MAERAPTATRLRRTLIIWIVVLMVAAVLAFVATAPVLGVIALVVAMVPFALLVWLEFERGRSE